MSSNHHHNITKILDKIVKSYSYLKTEKRIKIMDKDTNTIIDYDPDYAIKKNLTGHTYYFVVFEVIDKQTGEKTIADIARIVATQEIRKAVFISCSKKKKEETEKIMNALLGSYKERFAKKNKKEIIEISSRLILPDDPSEKLEKIIKEELREFIKKPKI